MSILSVFFGDVVRCPLFVMMAFSNSGFVVIRQKEEQFRFFVDVIVIPVEDCVTKQ